MVESAAEGCVDGVSIAETKIEIGRAKPKSGLRKLTTSCSGSPTPWLVVGRLKASNVEFMVARLDAKRELEALVLPVGEKYEVMDWKKGILVLMGVLADRWVEL